MNISIICGSHRQNSQSLKISNYIQSDLKKLFPEIETEIIELQKLNLPFFDFGITQKPEVAEVWNPVSQSLKESQGYVIVCPEYGGMATPILKNFFLCVSGQNKEMAFKPGLLVGVSSSRGGAYPISELRSSSYKNSRINYIPEQIIVRDCEQVLNNQELNPEDKGDYYLKNRISYTLKILLKYAEQSQDFLGSDLIDFESFGNGM
jgi:azobenzene reductase